MGYRFDGNAKLCRLRAALRAPAANTQQRARKPRVTFCRDCGEPIYAATTAPFGIRVDGVHACRGAA